MNTDNTPTSTTLSESAPNSTLSFSEPGDPPETLLELNLHQLLMPLVVALEKLLGRKLPPPEPSVYGHGGRPQETARLTLVEQPLPAPMLPVRINRIIEKLGSTPGAPLKMAFSHTSFWGTATGHETIDCCALLCSRSIGVNDVRVIRQIAALVKELGTIELQPDELKVRQLDLKTPMERLYRNFYGKDFQELI